MERKLKIIISVSIIMNLFTIIALWLNVYQNYNLRDKNQSLQDKIISLKNQIEENNIINPNVQRDFSSPDEKDLFNWFWEFFNKQDLNPNESNWLFIDWPSNLNLSNTTIINWKEFSYNISQNWNKISGTIKSDDKELLTKINIKLKELKINTQINENTLDIKWENIDINHLINEINNISNRYINWENIQPPKNETQNENKWKAF